MKRNIFILFIGFLLAGSLQAQTKQKLTLEDAVLGYYKGLYPKRLSNLQWSQDKDVFLYRTDSSWIIKNTQGKIEEEISLKELDKHVDDTIKRMPYATAFGYGAIAFRQDSVVYFYRYKEKKSDKIVLPGKAENVDIHLKTKQIAYTVDNNLFVATPDNNRLTVVKNFDKNIVSGQSIARNEFGISKGTFWSPGGNYLAFYQKNESQVDTYPLVDITQTPAALKEIKYPMNGRGSEEPSVGIFSPEIKKTVFIENFTEAGPNHYITNLAWGPGEKYIYVAELNRDQNHMWFNQYEAATGKFVKTLFEETNDKWVEPEHPAYFIPGTNYFIWLSERDGFMNLYKYDTNGRLIKQLTKNQWVTLDILGFSQDGKYVYTLGTGKDPREQHLFQINTKTGNQKQLTKKAGFHRIKVSPSGNFYLDDYSALDFPGKVCLKSTRNKKYLVELLKADNPLKNYQTGKVEFFTIKGEFTDVLYGRIIKPSGFDPSKKYPVLVYVYGGPHVQLVQNRWLGGAPLWMYWLAEQGYIVFTLDGHGSARRGFDFESVIFRQLGQVEARDQMDGLAYLRTFPWVDKDRIAVHGWSFGGFMTLTLLTEYPEAFTTGVAGGPVTDWKWYEVMYGERYMDTYKQNPGGFKKTSILNKIQNLQAKLLTIHGYMDDVVVPQHNIALHDAAIARGIQMDFYLYPRAKHNVYGKRRLHLMKKILYYIMQNNQKN